MKTRIVSALENYEIFSTYFISDVRGYNTAQRGMAVKR